MTQRWANQTLEELLVLNRSGYWGDETPSKSRPIEVNVIRNADLTKHNSIKGSATRYFSPKEAANAELQIGDIAMSSSGDVGKAWLVDELGYTASNFIRILRPDSNHIMPGFLRYVLDSDIGQAALSASTAGTTIQNLQRTFYSMLTVPLPPLDEQQRIVRLLDEAFEGIAIAKANAEQNLRNTRALCESYLRAAFTQGVLERDGGEGGQGGSMSVSWPVRTLAEICQLMPGKREARIKLNPADEVSFVPMEDLGVNSMWVEALKSRPLSEVDGSYTYFAEGDVLLAKITPCFENGKLGIAKNLINGVGFGSSEYFVLRPDATVSPEWLYHYLNRESFRLEGAARMSGAVGHRRVTKEFIENYPIPVPLLSEQQRIISRLDELVGASDVLASAYVKKLASLGDLQKSLLHQAFRGELEAA